MLMTGRSVGLQRRTGGLLLPLLLDPASTPQPDLGTV